MNHQSAQILKEEPDHPGDNLPDGSDSRKHNQTEPIRSDGPSQTQTTWSDRPDLKGAVQLKNEKQLIVHSPTCRWKLWVKCCRPQNVWHRAGGGCQPIRAHYHRWGQRRWVCSETSSDWETSSAHTETLRDRKTLEIVIYRYTYRYMWDKMFVMRSNVETVIQKVIIEGRS